MGVFLYSLRFLFYYFISFYFCSRFYITIIISILYHLSLSSIYYILSSLFSFN